MTDSCPRTFYFGCWDRAGHHLWLAGRGGQPTSAYDQGATTRRLLGSYPHGREREPGEIPWGYGLDGGILEPRDERGRREPVRATREGEAVVEHRDGWTALSFWDYSVDSRSGSSSTFVFDQILDGPAALAEARRAFSAVFDRFDFDVVLQANDFPLRHSEDAMSDARRYTVAVDFDGVLHSYTTPWSGAASCPDPPVPGAIEWLNEIVDKFDVVILTTRGDQEGGNEAVQAWLKEHGYTGPDLRVTSEKVPALVYIDDRAWRFEGDNFPTADQIHRAVPWTKRTETG